MNARGGGCCIDRYSATAAVGGGSGGAISYGISNVEKIMLKFRPIAPKPLAAGSGSSCSTSDGYGGTPRRKRKYVRSKGKQTKKDAITTRVSKKQKVSVPLSSSISGAGGDEVVTLSLMPETPDRKEKSPAARSLQIESPDLLSPKPFSCNNQQRTVSDGDHVVSVTDHSVVVTSPRVISFVTVECVWMNGGELGFAEEPPPARMIEMDTCPVFITDNGDVVVWTNRAYREMTTSTAGGGEVVVVVVKKYYHRLTASPAFTCKVKVTWGTETESRSSPSTLTAPCDVWRLQSGGYAWRLDVKAALFLGR